MDSFGRCEICEALSWSPVYEGRIRDGVFGNYREGAVIARCGSCGVERLHESCCPPPQIYESEAYRAKLAEGDYYKTHDELQLYTQAALWPLSLRGAVVADVGCAGGALLDQYAAIADRLIGIEPSDIYHAALQSRGYSVYPYAAAAVKEKAKVDYAFSIQVIEHVQNPRRFLEEIRQLLKAGAKLLVSTPNRDDILMKILRSDYASFFYRVVHRWYFDRDSLAKCARLAGFELARVRYVHRYPLSNALAWLRDRAPKGRDRLAGITELGDELWRQFLVETGQTDCIYMELCTRENASSP
jgi:2-polyprenyl-3-methyl-5-hydroxy-6-metoxy-1,4-benzoquinol methylase